MRLEGKVAIFGEHDEGTLAQIRRAAADERVIGAALLADGHKGYAVPIGGVVAYDGAISINGVGYDIGCGNKAVKTNLRLDESGHPQKSPLKPDKLWADYAMDLVWKHISFGMGRHNHERVDNALFDDDAWQIPAVRALRDKAASQLGTVGGGNHYCDLLEDEDGWLWIGVHFGSRGLGHGIATHYLKRGGAVDNMDASPLVVNVADDMGAEYIAAMNLALRYAYAGRDWVCAKVARLLGTEITYEVHNNHNDARLEQGKWIVRKGATPAWPGQQGFVGGSMGDDAVIVEGRDSQGLTMIKEQLASMYSTVHGAGRVMSRTAAKGKFNRKTGEQKSAGAITREDMLAWVRRRGVELRGADVDESPQAYKRLPDVLAHHAATIRVLHTLHPVGVAMAGSNTRDPYRD